MHWCDGPMLGLDFETDDREPTEARIVTAALVHYAPGGEPVARSWVARPTRPIPEEAAKIHGYTTGRAEAEGQDPAQVIAQVREAIAGLWSSSCPLVIYNAPYDTTVLDRELGRHHGTVLDLGGLPIIDPLVIDRRADKWRAGERKLAVTCGHYGIELRDAHSAVADVMATMRLAWRLGTTRRWPRGRYGPAPEERESRAVLARGCSRELHNAQGPWYRDSALSLAAYWRTPKAPAKLCERRDQGAITAEECDELISTLAQRADDVERNADGWPMRQRSAVPSGG